jgi:hypothetical protein
MVRTIGLTSPSPHPTVPTTALRRCAAPRAPEFPINLSLITAAEPSVPPSPFVDLKERVMKMRIAVVSLLLVSLMSAIPVFAHEETFKGTVIALEKAGVRMNVVDPKTKKTTVRLFEIDKDTKILRGDTLLTLETAKFTKGEAIAVTVNHDDDEHYALVIRLGASK